MKGTIPQDIIDAAEADCLVWDGDRATLLSVIAHARLAERKNVLDWVMDLTRQHDGVPCCHHGEWTVQQREMFDKGQRGASYFIALCIEAYLRRPDNELRPTKSK